MVRSMCVYVVVLAWGGSGTNGATPSSMVSTPKISNSVCIGKSKVEETHSKQFSLSVYSPILNRTSSAFSQKL